MATVYWPPAVCVVVLLDCKLLSSEVTTGWSDSGKLPTEGVLDVVEFAASVAVATGPADGSEAVGVEDVSVTAGNESAPSTGTGDDRPLMSDIASRLGSWITSSPLSSSDDNSLPALSLCSGILPTSKP
jgi:hypothetical protein